MNELDIIMLEVLEESYKIMSLEELLREENTMVKEQERYGRKYPFFSDALNILRIEIGKKLR